MIEDEKLFCFALIAMLLENGAAGNRYAAAPEDIEYMDVAWCVL